MTYKRLVAVLSALTLLCLSLHAQNPLREKVLANIELAAGNNSLYDFNTPALTKAPKGYKPVYISHYARHGARYAWEDLYSRIDTVLLKMAQADNLTEFGKELSGKVSKLREITAHHVGELAPLGWKQHRRIAMEMVDNFPEVFRRKDAKVWATSSDAQRCIMSMASFCLGVKEKSPSTQIEEVVGENWYQEVIPTGSANPFRKHAAARMTPFTREQYRAIFKNQPKDNDVDVILSRIFKDVAAFETDYIERHRFVRNLHELAVGMYSLEFPVTFEGVFTPEEEFRMWDKGNRAGANSMLIHCGSQYPIVESIVKRAEASLKTGETVADLRFGHDSMMMPLIVLLNINGSGNKPSSMEEAGLQFQNYNVPMASTLLFVLYRSKKSDDVLFKVLWNGRESTLPLTPVQGPYYKWSDFVAYAATLKTE